MQSPATRAAIDAIVAMQSAKTQAAIDTIIANLSPDQIADLTTNGTESTTYAAITAQGDPFWAVAVVAQVHQQVHQ